MAKYTEEMRERAVRMFAEVRPEYPNTTAAMRHVAGLLGVHTETMRLWVNRAQIDAGQRPGTTSEAMEEIKRLKRENAELRRANEILKSASVFFAKELDRPTTR